MSDAQSVIKQLHQDDYSALTELALNLHWSWNHASDELWKQLDAELWEVTQNPWVILQTVSKEKVSAALASPEFRERLHSILDADRDSYTENAWFQEKHPNPALTLTAYFSMEFMLSEALPIYSGGLGNVAGDQLKAASDLGVPVVGIGLLYGQGYFRQDFDVDGQQQALYPVNDPGQLPIRPLRKANGEWLRLRIQLPGTTVWVRCWEASVGRSKLYLLDMNDFANPAAVRGVTSQLYGGDAEMRLKQEMVLGIAGWRLLRALGLKPEVCHLNEGHAAFAVLERARSYMEDHHVCFDVAMLITRAGNVFTTHTAVPAGFDRFDPELIRKYLTHYAQDELFLSIDQMLALGRQDATDQSEHFNMAYLALRGSCQVNGVSKLHGQVSRQIFQQLFPHHPQQEVPIGSVTNGIHVPSWDSAAADSLWTKACGKKRWRGDAPVGEAIRQLSDREVWQMCQEGKSAVLARIRARYLRQLLSQGRILSEIPAILDDHVLTLGFARRFATYKRPDLLLHDPDRLIRLLSDPQRPAQLILAGKAHPQDLPGQALIKRWNDFIRRPEVQSRVVFLSDYDMLLAQELVQGVDLWINTPRRPWEACGTSGMKVLANGGLNLSELDGWWAEAYSPEVGWAIGDGKEHGDDPAWDDREAETLYATLEQEIIPQFYERDKEGLPSQWLGQVRESMAQLTPQFSATRTIRDYTESHYLPAASAYCARAASGSALGTTLFQWRQRVAQNWDAVCIGSVSVETREGQHCFRAQLFLGDLHPDEIRAEMYAVPMPNQDSESAAMMVCKTCVHPAGTWIFTIQVPAARPASDFTARILPYHPSAFLPLELPRILWQT